VNFLRKIPASGFAQGHKSTPRFSHAGSASIICVDAALTFELPLSKSRFSHLQHGILMDVKMGTTSLRWAWAEKAFAGTLQSCACGAQFWRENGAFISVYMT
jgi:hypothetical protein